MSFFIFDCKKLISIHNSMQILGYACLQLIMKNILIELCRLSKQIFSPKVKLCFVWNANSSWTSSDKQLSCTLIKYKLYMFSCASAIRFNKQNIKAYYRKAVALKSLKKYGEALAVATAGRNITGTKPAEVSI